MEFQNLQKHLTTDQVGVTLSQYPTERFKGTTRYYIYGLFLIRERSQESYNTSNLTISWSTLPAVGAADAMSPVTISLITNHQADATVRVSFDANHIVFSF